MKQGYSAFFYEVRKHIIPETKRVSYAIHSDKETIQLFLDLMENFCIANMDIEKSLKRGESYPANYKS